MATGARDIIKALERDANIAARAHAEACAAFMRAERLADMESVIDDIDAWLDERGDALGLARHGVSRISDDGRIAFSAGGRSMMIRPRDDMSIVVDGRIMHPNRDCPVLDEPFYAAVVERIEAWAFGENDVPRRAFG